MSIDEPKAGVIARRLRDAYLGGPVPSLRNEVDATDAAMAYAIQNANTVHWINAGREVSGKKIGLTAKAVQTQLGVDQPDFGTLFSDMEVADGGTLDPADVIQPKAEAEIALKLGESLEGPNVSAKDVARAVESACVAIEIVDSRIEDWKITFADTVADNGSSSHYVLGAARHELDGLDLYTCGMVLEIDGAVASMGVGAACLGHPLEAAAWLARTVGLEAGHVVLTGALGPMVAIQPGQTIVAKVGGVGTASFTYGAAA